MPPQQHNRTDLPGMRGEQPPLVLVGTKQECRLVLARASTSLIAQRSQHAGKNYVAQWTEPAGGSPERLRSARGVSAPQHSGTAVGSALRCRR
ncbi:MAG TPA: hypothetical protein VK701_07170 [Solirubrobacteraceae bacterium]|nr:hypothetical protein [Solirubrobacteraceae bacterium]